MNLSQESGGFWRQWDIEILNFHVVWVINFIALAFLATMPKTYGFTKIIDLANWSLIDLFIYLGPIVASAASLLVVDSVTWLVSYDFGAQNKEMIYWVMVTENLLIQVAGNGTSVLLSGAYGLIAFGILTAFAFLPIVALSNPVSLILAVLFFLVVVGPIMVDAFGFFLFGSFIILATALVIDFVSLLITDPATAINSFQDIFDNGLASAIIQDFEDTVEEYLGDGFTQFFGTQTLQDILDDIGLHLALHIFVVLPLAVVLAIIKLVVIVAVAAVTYFQEYPEKNFLDFEIPDIVGDLANVIGWYIMIFDGLLVLVIEDAFTRITTTLEYDTLIGNRMLSVCTQLFSQSLFTVESDYWGIYFLIRLYQREYSVEETSSDQPQVEASDFQIIDGLASLLASDSLEQSEDTFVETFDQPYIVVALLPLVQGLTWAYQVPFFQDMWYHIRGFTPL